MWILCLVYFSYNSEVQSKQGVINRGKNVIFLTAKTCLNIFLQMTVKFSLGICWDMPETTRLSPPCQMTIFLSVCTIFCGLSVCRASELSGSGFAEKLTKALLHIRGLRLRSCDSHYRGAAVERKIKVQRYGRGISTPRKLIWCISSQQQRAAEVF